MIATARQHLGAVFGGVALVEEEGRTLRFVSLDPLPADVQRARMSTAIDSSRPVAIAARQRRALFFESSAAAEQGMDPETAAAARAAGGRSFAYLPMVLGAKVVGTLALFWDHERHFDADVQEVLWALARYAAQAADRAQLLAQRREVASTLQEALLPVLPSVSWVDMYGHYQPARVTERVGGDWYDAFVGDPVGGSGDADLTVSVGDVAGHDTHAASEMGRVVAKLRALCIDRPDEPGVLLQRLEKVMTANVHNRHASALVATLARDPDGSAILSYSNAGHPPPLLLEPGHAPVFLQTPPDPLLGVSEVLPTRVTHTHRLPLGSTLLLYTDGLIERRREDMGIGLARLARAADRHRGLALPKLVTHVIAEATHGLHDDDTALLALRLGPE